MLAETAKDKRFKALRDAIKLLDPELQPKLRETIVGTWISGPYEVTLAYWISLDGLESQPIDIRKFSFPQIPNVITANRPTWSWIPRSRAYHLRVDEIHNRYKDEIVDPWIRSLKEEGEKSLIGAIEVSSKVAKELVTSALEREDNRYKRELDGKNKPVDQGAVQHLTAIFWNLVAAEEALRELYIRVEGLQAQD